MLQTAFAVSSATSGSLLESCCVHRDHAVDAVNAVGEAEEAHLLEQRVCHTK